MTRSLKMTAGFRLNARYGIINQPYGNCPEYQSFQQFSGPNFGIRFSLYSHGGRGRQQTLPVNERNPRISGENPVVGLNAGVTLASTHSLSSNPREPAVRKNVCFLAYTGQGAVGRFCQQNHGVELGRPGGGSPKTLISNPISIA